MDWLKYKKIYFSISGILILVSLVFLLTQRLKLGVDFTGGTSLEYRFGRDVSSEEIITSLQSENIDVIAVSPIGERSFNLRLGVIEDSQKESISQQLSEKFEGVTELKYEKLGPSIGPEMIKKTAYAIIVAASLILLWVAHQFRSLKFGTSAILAMLHDSFILIGAFSVLGYFFGAEVDFLFVTALLTTLSFSVHDTIVVFDRIREITKKEGGSDLVGTANKALGETMVRSLNNSFTIVFMLLALLLLGGTSIRWFAVALLIGTILGTYSSPFVAVPLLVTWDGAIARIKSFTTKVPLRTK